MKKLTYPTQMLHKSMPETQTPSQSSTVRSLVVVTLSLQFPLSQGNPTTNPVQKPKIQYKIHNRTIP